MSKDQNNGGDEAAPRGKPVLSDDLVERIKNAILFGVGYGRPPADTRFKKGQSGNPNGRPKMNDPGIGSSRSANTLALQEGERLIAVREGEKIRKIPAIKAVFRAQLGSATKGNAYAQKHVIERYDRAERERRQQRMNEIEIWEAYVADQRAAIADAKAKGETPPTPLPHPDDVLIDYDKGVRFIGPTTETEVVQLEETLRVRDTLIIQNALDEREASTLKSDDPDRPGTAWLIAELLSTYIPERYTLSETEIMRKMMHYNAVPKRDLLKELYRAWRALGVRVPRGTTFPPLRVGKQLLEQLADLIAESAQGET